MTLFLIRTFGICFLHLILALSCEKKIMGIPDKIKPFKSNVPAVPSNAIVIREYNILPVVTDPAITLSTNANFVSVQEGGILKNTLFLFLPGTNRVPAECKAISRKAASLGFHVIGLMYSNQTAVNPECSPTNDTTCHRRMRHEVIDGIDRHPSVNVNPTHSILNRVTKLLLYLQKTYPGQNWGQYLLNGKPNWPKIIISGHSQGGCIAGLIGKLYPIKKVIQFSAIDFMNNGKIPDYQKLTQNRDRYFGLTSMKDELIPWDKLMNVWKLTGWTKYGPVVIVDYNLPPYQNTQTLVTTNVPKTTLIDKYHNGTAVDAYIPKNVNGTYLYEKAWEYMLLK